jgi:E3 ubiquitin-protein ligase RGLG
MEFPSCADFTKSNEWTGKVSFGGRCLHDIAPPALNPYESSIMIIGETLSVFDDDNLIPAYGFGSAATNDRAVFSLLPRDAPCVGFTGVLDAYRRVLPNVKLAGPTSFAPVIRKAANIVQGSGNQYHILLIICDGQVTRSSDLPQSELSTQERDTIQAIIEASQVPLSIICVGVGDGEDGWKRMKEFDDLIPSRRFDNFQFVPLNETLEVARRKVRASAPAALKTAMESTFALQALMEIPQQYRAIVALGLMSARPRLSIPVVAVLDPPVLPPTSSRFLLPVGLPHSDIGLSPPAVVPSTWACPQCTMIQPAGSFTCVMCGYSAQLGVGAPSNMPAQPPISSTPHPASASCAEAQLSALREEKLCSI